MCIHCTPVVCESQIKEWQGHSEMVTVNCSWQFVLQQTAFYMGGYFTESNLQSEIAEVGREVPKVD